MTDAGVDVGRGRNGVVYVLQITTTGLAGPPSPGRLVRVAADGTQIELAAGDLENPTGLAVAPSGDANRRRVSDSGGSAENVGERGTVRGTGGAAADWSLVGDADVDPAPVL